MFTRNGLFVRNLRLSCLESTDENEGGGNENQQHEETFDFPADTPVKDMTPEQQSEYWRGKAQKHEKLWKNATRVDPVEVERLRTENQTLRRKTLSADEKVIDDAKEAGRAEVRVQLASERVKNALEKALAGRMPDASALLDLDRKTFIKGDSADVDAIKTWVEANSTEATVQKRGGPDLGQGRERGTDSPTKGVGAGAGLFTSTRKTKSTNS